MDADELLRHGTFLRALATGLLGDETGADDVVQDAYARAIVHGPRHPGAWLARVVRNLAIRGRIGGARRSRRERVAARPEAEPSAADVVARLEIQRRVVEAVLALREPYRTTIVQRYFDGLETREIARRSGVPYETVRTRLGRAHAELRERLDAVHHGWALALAPIGMRPRLPVAGGVLMTAKQKLALVGLPLLGVLAGAAGHAAYAGPSSTGRAGSRASAGTAPAGAELETLRVENEALRRENVELRERLRAAEETSAPAARDAGAADAIDWTALLPLLRAEARNDPDRKAQRDAAHGRQMEDLIERLAARGLLREGMQLQDLWRVPAVGAEIAFAFAREADPKLTDAAREEILGSLQAIDAALPEDPLEIELLAAVEEQLAAAEEILARRSTAATARQALDEVAPLWRRRYWQTLRLGATTKEEIGEIVAGIVGDLPEEAKARVLGVTGRMVEEFGRLRSTLAQRYGEETVRAALLEPGAGGADEAVLELRRKAEGYRTAEQAIRAAVARHQAAFEREYYRGLPPAAQEDYARFAATLMLYDLAR
jgi:RNA polymerase sigma-70 factor (ECF subfamily)